ncbi:hypothetical protein GUY44_12170 [Pimelobacter simplex]|uniref:hypothetical protein n=1 Tax=Nocardioides simplex TaxID=2045 RepID=UPI00068A3C99|nr:hypothetical protein [Pimelobacter simplex]MCG8151239.1 hypothetical protein [Pimelobacter simplex]GEB17164.1 hypothetical protein NSI01_54790 [Pimelobacter simplex]SFN19213.1 hypothetical protein SAMN05421671_0055 [Pimelobacter simplex]
MYHPFRHLLSYFRDGDGMTMSIEPTPGGKAEWYSPAEDHMMLRPGQLQVERRCAVAHGLAHRDLGHSGVCEYPDAVRQASRAEMEADELAARRLIRLAHFIEVLCWTDDKDEAADALWVTRHYLDVRLERMYMGEQKIVREALIARGVP